MTRLTVRLLTTLLLTTLACPVVLAQGCQPRALSALPAKPPLEGQAVQAIACKDAEGEHLFIESRAQPEPVRGKPQPQVLSFYKFTLGAGQTAQRRWQARDFLPMDDNARALSTTSARADRFVVKDIDGDGLAEAFISYALPGRAGAGSEGKLLVFYKDRKYAIRGAVAQGPDDFASRTVDPSFQTLPLSVQTYALTLWDQVALPRAPIGPGGAPVIQASLR
jgi:hypothetical protein